MGLDIWHVIPSAKTKDTIEYFTLDEFRNNNHFLTPHQHLIVQIDHEDGTREPVLYFAGKGYHRKNVTPDFIHNIENCKLYFDIGIVKKVKLFLKAEKEDEQREIEGNFQANFIDNFVEGESIFFASW